MSTSSASKSRASTAASTARGDAAVSTSKPSPLRRSFSASRTSAWSSATRSRDGGEPMQLRLLFRSQRYHGVHSSRSLCGHQAGRHGHHEEQERNDAKTQRISGRNPKELTT